MPDLELDRATLEQLARLIRDAADLLDSVDGAAYPGDIGLAAASVDESLVDAAFRQVRRSDDLAEELGRIAMHPTRVAEEFGDLDRVLAGGDL